MPAIIPDNISFVNPAPDSYSVAIHAERDALLKENAALKEQVAQQQAGFNECIKEDIDIQVAQQKEINALKETIAQQAEALRVKDEALLAYPVRGEYFMEHLDATWMRDKALAIPVSSDILRERDARLVERIADTCGSYYVPRFKVIADQIRKGEWKS